MNIILVVNLAYSFILTDVFQWKQMVINFLAYEWEELKIITLPPSHIFPK